MIKETCAACGRHNASDANFSTFWRNVTRATDTSEGLLVCGSCRADFESQTQAIEGDVMINEHYDNLQSWCMGETARRISNQTADVVRHLKAMGVNASHEYQDVICITRDEHWCWNFGTANEQWGGDLCNDGDPQQTVTLPFYSSDNNDPHEIAEVIAWVTDEQNGYRTFVIDGQDWEGTSAAFANANHTLHPQELLQVLRLKVGEACTIGGGAAARVTIRRKGVAKRVEWSYASSTNAEKFGFGKTGCWTLEIIGMNGMPKAAAGFAERQQAIDHGNKLPQPWHALGKHNDEPKPAPAKPEPTSSRSPFGPVSISEPDKRQEEDGFVSVALSNSDSLVATVWGADKDEATQRAVHVMTACNRYDDLVYLVTLFTEQLREGRNESVTEHKLAMLDGGCAADLIEQGERVIRGEAIEPHYRRPESLVK